MREIHAWNSWFDSEKQGNEGKIYLASAMHTVIETPNVNRILYMKISRMNRFFAGVACMCAVLFGVSKAAAQNLFAEGAGTGGNVVEISPGGTQTAVGYGNDTGPASLAFDSSGDLFTANNESIMEITPSGQESTFVSGLDFPTALAFNSSGVLFAANIDGGNIVAITSNGSIAGFYPSGIGSPYSLAFNRAGDLFQSDYYDGLICEYAPNGTRTIFASGLGYDWGLAFNAAGDLFVSSYRSGDIYQYAPDGTQSLFASGLVFPQSLAFNSSGTLFAATEDGIIEISPVGAESTFVAGNYSALAFQGLTLPVPEPGGLILFPVGVAMMFAGRRFTGGQGESGLV